MPWIQFENIITMDKSAIIPFSDLKRALLLENDLEIFHAESYDDSPREGGLIARGEKCELRRNFADTRDPAEI